MRLMTTPETAQTTDFSAFYTVHFGRIAAQLHAYLGDRWEAQDLTQEAFCRAFERWDRISAYDLPEAWVRQVAWNLAANRRRHLRVALRYLAGQREEHVEGPSPDRVALTRALAKLPPKHRLAVVLHHIGQLSTAEIAQQQNVAEGTVRSWLSRGRSQLNERLNDGLGGRLGDAPAIAAPGIDKTISRVRRRRALRRATLAGIFAIMVALPLAIILRSTGSEPPIIGPTSPASSPTPTPSPAVSPTPAARAISACTGNPLARIPNAPAAVFSGGEPTGRYLVGEISEPAGSRPVLWTDGNPSTFLVPGKTLTGLAVNSHGVVAGSTSRDGHSGFSLWTYHDGRLDVLHETDNPAEARSVAGINARGDILFSEVTEPAITRPPSIRLAGPNPVYRDLPLPDGTQVVVHDLGEDGTVVGSTVDGHAVYWTPDLVVHKLPAPLPDGWRAGALSVSGDWAVGIALSAKVPRSSRVDRVVLRWNLRTGAVNQVPDMDIASAVTAHGWVLGGDKDHKPILDMDGKRMPLPAISGRSSTENLFTFFTSDDGRVIVGETKIAGSGANVAIGWTCS